MNKTYKNKTKTLQEAYVIIEDFVDTMDKMKEETNLDYRFRINKENEEWIIKMFVNEKETMDQIFGRNDKPPTVL